MKKFLFGIFIVTMIFSCHEQSGEKIATNETSSETSSAATKQGDEILPMTEAEVVKNSILAFAKGDIERMAANYDDNARLIWSNLDSVVGKKAIQDFFTERWKVIDSITYTEQVILPVRTSVGQRPYTPPGKWVFVWSFTHAKYKNGKRLDFWVHTATHVNDAGKIDHITEYMDWAPIKEITKGIK